MEEELTDQLDLQTSDDEPQVPAVHNKLLGAVSQLYEKKRVKAPTRKEPSLEVSEFHLSQLNKKPSSRVKVTDLAKVLNKRAIHADISQKLKTAEKRAKTLPKPLEQIHADRIARAAGYEHAKRQLNRWDAIVYHQKVAEQLSFPLKSDSVSYKSQVLEDYSKMFRKPTELELKLAELEKQSVPLGQQKEQDQTSQKEKIKEEYPLSLAEVIEKRKMMAKLRAQESYRQSKAARHSKIKSKKFHQIQRRIRVKQQLLEFEELQKKDPEAALKKLEELERTRAEERVTLRHRSTGQWARNLAVRAKYDKEARVALAEQLTKSRELTVKLVQPQDTESEKEEEEEVRQYEPAEEDPDNPWVVKRSKEMEEFVSGYQKYWQVKNKELEKNETVDTAVTVNNCQVTTGGAAEKENSDKENSQPEPCGESNNKPDDAENSAGSNDELNSLKTKKLSPCKNVFSVNDTPVKRNHNNKVEAYNKMLSRFTISCTTGKNKKVRTANSSAECTKSQTHNSSLKKTEIKCKSGSWSVTKTKPTSSKNSKRSKKVIDNRPKKVQISSDSYEVTESKVTNMVVDLNTGPNNKSFKTNENVPENTEEREQKVKSLDELFEELEDQLQSRARDTLEILKKKLNRKTKNEVESEKELDTEALPGLELKKKKVYADLDEELLEQPVKNIESLGEGGLVAKTIETALSEVIPAEDIDPNKFLKLTPRHLSSKLPDVMTEGDDALDDEQITARDRYLTISEAFAEDDVVDQFQKEKEEEVKKNTVGDVDLTLPGWGRWAGHNMKPVSRRRRKKFVIKFPKIIPRRDTNRGRVIINEDADKSLKQYQVSDIPFPFTSVKEYEASIRIPLGSTWVSQMAHRKLTQPPIVTQMGAIIQPMDETQLVKKETQLPTNRVNKNKKQNRKPNKK